MSSLDRVATNSQLAAASKRRLRRDGRRAVEDNDRVRASLHAPDALTKQTTRNPLRFLPDVTGFHPLTKNEVKRDSREIDKRSGLMSVLESDSEDEADNLVKKSTYPMVPAESNLFKKRKNYIAWNAQPEQMVNDIAHYHAMVVSAKNEHDNLERDEERWAECMDVARTKLTNSYNACVEHNHRLVLEAKQLYGMIVAECGPVLSSKKRRAAQMHDIFTEMDHRQDILDNHLDEYMSLALSATDTTLQPGTEESNKTSMKGYPIVRMSVEELNYPEDIAAFASFLPHPTTSTNMKSLRQNQGKKTNAGTSTSTDPIKEEFKTMIKDEKDTTKKNTMDGGIDKDKEKNNKSSSRGNNNGGGSHRSNANTSRSRVVGEPIPMAEGEVIASSTMIIEDKEEDEEEEEDDEDDGQKPPGAVSEFCALIAAVESAVKLSEGSLMDLDPFFSDDEGEDDITMGGNSSSSSGGMMNGEGGGKERGERFSSGPLGASIWDSKAEYLKTKKLAEPYFPKSTIHMASIKSSGVAGSVSNERPDEETTITSMSSSSVSSNIPVVSVPVKPRDVELHWAQAIAEACQCPDLAVRPGTAVPGQAPRRTRLGRGAGAGAVNLIACPISRTPRGVPLMISPLSQFEDRFLGSICGPSSSSMSLSAPSASSNIDATGIANMASMFSSNKQGGMGQPPASSLLVYPTPNIPPLPPSLLIAEDAVMERCRLQSMAAAAANKIKRLRMANSDWSKQVNDVQLSLQKCTNFFAQAARDDVVESKIIRRELLTYGIVTAKDTDPPLSPVGEYPAVYLTTKGVKGAAKSSGGAAKKGSKNGKGISAQMSFGMPNLTGGSANTQTLLSHASSSSHAGATMPGSSQSSAHSTFGGDQSKGDVSSSPPGDVNDSMQVVGDTEPVGGNEGGADVSVSLDTSPVLKEKRGKDSKDRKSKGKETAAQGKDSAGTSSNEVTQAVVGGLSTSVGSNEGTAPLHPSEEEAKDGSDTKKRGTKASAAAAAAEPTTTANSSAVSTTADPTTTTAPPASKARRR